MKALGVVNFVFILYPSNDRRNGLKKRTAYLLSLVLGDWVKGGINKGRTRCRRTFLRVSRSYCDRLYSYYLPWLATE